MNKKFKVLSLGSAGVAALILCTYMSSYYEGKHRIDCLDRQGINALILMDHNDAIYDSAIKMSGRNSLSAHGVLNGAIAKAYTCLEPR